MIAKPRQSYPCYYCFMVLYSKSAHTTHTRRYHWEELEKEAKILDEIKLEQKKGKKEGV